MTQNPKNDPSVPVGNNGNRNLTPEAQRALAEAKLRRDERKAAAQKREKELKGRDGPEPTRYGDWEKDGITSDF